MMQDRAKRLGSAKIPSLLVRFATPAVVGMLAQALYNIVDRVFVGQAIGALGIAGTTLVFPFMLVLLAFSMLVGFGAAAFVSIRLGEGRKDEAERALGNAVVLLTLLSLAITAVTLVAIDPLLELLGAGPQSAPFARQYLEIIAWGALFQSISFGLNAVVRGEGNPRIAMYTMLIGALLNSLLDPLFLFQFGWGMRGAAAATVISQAVSGMWVLGYFLSGSSLLRLRSGHLRLHWPLCGKLLVLGSPMFAMQLAGSVMNIVLHNQLRFFGGGQGDLAISAIGIIHSVAHFIAMPITGLSQGAQPIIGYNHGARRHERVRRTLMLTILCASVLCVIGFVLVMLFPARVIGLFNRQDEALLDLGTHAMRICLIMLPVIGFQIVGAGYFQAVGKPQHALLLGLSRQVLLLIPALYVLPMLFGLDGVWLAIPVADFCSSLLTGIWLLFELRSLNDSPKA